MDDQQKQAVEYFVSKAVSDLSTLIWEDWQQNGQVEAVLVKPPTWERAPLIVELRAKIVAQAAILGIDDIDQRLALLLGRPFNLKEYIRRAGG